MPLTGTKVTAMAAITILGFAQGALAQMSDSEKQFELRLKKLEKENAELHKKVDAMTGQLEQFEFRDIIPVVGDSVHGLGPAASKVYSQEQGFSVGGYGEGVYTSESGDENDEADFLRAVLYTGYKFNDNWVFNSEIEFEHASTGEGGSVSVEFAYLEYLHNECFNVIAGLLLVPMGIVNEMHEPTTFYGPSRPQVETRILPSTWRENGVGVHGDLGCFSYKVYLMNGFDGSDFDEKGLRGGRQKGSEAKAEDLAAVARIDVQPHPAITVGVSGYYGNSGQGDPALGDMTTTIVEAHAEARWRGLRVRGLYTCARVDDTARLFAASGTDMTVVGKKMVGTYVEAGYDVMTLTSSTAQHQVIPFVRVEWVDTQHEVASGLMKDPDQDECIFTVGVNWLPLDQLVFKAAYSDFDRGNDRFELGMGYVF